MHRIFSSKEQWINRIRRPDSLLVVALIAMLGQDSWAYGLGAMGIDFYHFWVAPQMLRADPPGDLYADQDRKHWANTFRAHAVQAGKESRIFRPAHQWQDLRPTGSPFFYTIWKWTLPEDYETAYQRFQLVSLLVFVGAIGCLSFLFGFSIPVFGLLLGVLAWGSFPYLADVRVANVQRIMLGIVALYLWIRSRRASTVRDGLSGCVLGLTMMFKPIVCFGIVLIFATRVIDRQKRELIWEASGLGIGMALGFVLSIASWASYRTWIDWLDQLPNIPREASITGGNYGLAALVQHWMSVTGSVYLTIGLLGVSIAAIWIRRLDPSSFATECKDGDDDQRGYAFWRDTQAIGLGLAVFLLSSSLVWSHYFLLMIPLAISQLAGFSVGATGRNDRSLRKTLIPSMWLLGVCMLALYPLRIVFPQSSNLVNAIVITTGTLILFILGLIETYSLKAAGHSARTGQKTISPSPRRTARNSH